MLCYLLNSSQYGCLEHLMNKLGHHMIPILEFSSTVYVLRLLWNFSRTWSMRLDFLDAALMVLYLGKLGYLII